MACRAAWQRPLNCFQMVLQQNATLFGDAVANLCKRAGLTSIQLLHAGLHRKGHIRTRIAVGNGEYVERVYLGAVQFKLFRPDEDHIPQIGTVDCFMHKMLLLLLLLTYARDLRIIVKK